MQDMELLRQYVAERSQQAFSAIVEQYAGMVYSSALRQTGDAHVAEDVTQTVFVDLSRTATSLRPRVVVGSWLLIATRYAVQMLRLAQRLAGSDNDPETVGGSAKCKVLKRVYSLVR